MRVNERVSDTDLDDIEQRTSRIAGEWHRAPHGGLERFALRAKGEDAAHLYAPPDVAEALTRATSDAARLAAALRRDRAELTRLREDGARAEEQARASRGRAAAGAAGVAEEAYVPLAAPFRVSPKVAKEAQTDPLKALAAQVAKALQEDAKDIERARLIAMALAVTTGDMDAFWAARRQRSASKVEARSPKKK